MTVKIEPSKACGKISAPPSKSIAHRALICGALSQKSNIVNIEYSADISATLDCLSALGADVCRYENGVTLGGLMPNNIGEATLNCRESGSTLRFMIPFAFLSGSKITFTGADRLFQRNLQVYEKIADDNGILFERHGNSLTVCGKLKQNHFKVCGSISSQFISGLLFALPLLPYDTTLEIEGVFESKPYVELTTDMLKKFGISIAENGTMYRVKGNQTLISNDITVEGDYSNAAFLDGFNLLGGDVTVEGLNDNSLQGDRVYRKMFYDLQNGKREFDLSDCPDLAPVMFALSACFGGAVFTGTRRLKIKESDRATAMAAELLKFGIKTDVYENTVVIHGGKLCTPTETIDGHNDHRIVMAMSMLCSQTGGVISGAEAVSKSFPDFFEKIKFLGIVVKNET